MTESGLKRNQNQECEDPYSRRCNFVCVAKSLKPLFKSDLCARITLTRAHVMPTKTKQNKNKKKENKRKEKQKQKFWRNLII